jgi:hypothetical protein
LLRLVTTRIACDLRASADNSNRHIRDDVRNVLSWGWDMIIVAHPPCTRLCNSGVRWLQDPTRLKNPGEDFSAQEKADWPTLSDAAKRELIWRKLDEGAALFSDLWNADCERVACENPIMHGEAKKRIRNYRAPAESVQPWEFGDWETKRTMLWERGLPTLEKLYRTKDEARAALGLPADAKPIDRVHKAPPGPMRNLERSKFFPGIARAMAEQWGALVA